MQTKLETIAMQENTAETLNYKIPFNSLMFQVGTADEYASILE